MDNEQQPTPVFKPEEPKRRRGSMVGGLIVLILGVLLLLQNYFPQVSMRLYGPIILIIVGFAILLPSMRR